MKNKFSIVTGPIVLASVLVACGGGGSTPTSTLTTPPPIEQSKVIEPVTPIVPTPLPVQPIVPEPIPLEAVTFQDLLTKGMFDLQLQAKDSTNTEIRPFVVRHKLGQTVVRVASVTPTAFTPTIIGSPLIITTPFDFTNFRTISNNDWRVFGLELTVEFTSPDGALVHYTSNGLNPSRWTWSMVREEVGGTPVVDTIDTISLVQATNPESKFIADTAAYYSRLTNNEQVVVYHTDLPTDTVTEQDLFDSFWCLTSEAKPGQLVMSLNLDATFTVLERPIGAVCAGPETTDTTFTGSWIRVTLEGKAGIEFTFPPEVSEGEYQSIFTPAEFAAKAKMVFLQTRGMTTLNGATTVFSPFTNYTVVFNVAPGAVIESDTARFSLRAVDPIKAAYGIQ